MSARSKAWAINGRAVAPRVLWLALWLVPCLPATAQRCLESVCPPEPGTLSLRLPSPAQIAAPLTKLARPGLAEWLDASSFGTRLQVKVDTRFDAERTLRQWRYGLGFDIDLPGSGQLQATLYTRSGLRKQGPRYNLTAPQSDPNRWSFGIYVAPVEAEGTRRIALAPQLKLHLDRWMAISGSAELSIEYAPWSTDDGEGPDDPVPQLGFRYYIDPRR